jgi:hypothetical protein
MYIQFAKNVQNVEPISSAVSLTSLSMGKENVLLGFSFY